MRDWGERSMRTGGLEPTLEEDDILGFHVTVGTIRAIR
jgi:hypothetical protein